MDRYFVEHRAKLLDVAAFLDRCDRAGRAGGPAADRQSAELPDDDFRLQALRRAAGLLVDGQPDRTRRVLETLSDLSVEPAAASPGGAACGAAYGGAGPAGGTDDPPT